MAVTSLWPIRNRPDKVISYIQNPEKVTEEYFAENSALHIIDGVLDYASDDDKTERREYVSCINCSESTAAKEFLEIKRLWKKTDGRPCYHGYQSFKPGEVNAQTAHAIGVELAKRLWGDRFQVVVATHCNTGVYHNHFVLNSVSFRDGVKFFNSHEDYRQMQAISDQICREYGISVIENPQKRGMHYSQYSSERNGKLTQSQMIRNDIDQAIAASQTGKQFFRIMREMGYVVTTHGKSGAPLKHPKLVPLGTSKAHRFDTLGEEYTLERIMERVQSNIRPVPLVSMPENRRHRTKTIRMPVKKLSGLRALYFRYCYNLGIIKKHPNYIKRVSYLMREDVIKLDRYIAETKLLTSNKIETGESLQAYRESLVQKLDLLTAKRKEYRNLLRRVSSRENGPSDEEIKADIKRLSDELRKLRKEIEYCDDILNRSDQVRDNLNELLHNQKGFYHEYLQGNHDKPNYR